MRLLPRRTFLAALFAGLTGLLLAAAPASAQVTAFRQAVAESVASEDGVAAFYRGRDFQGIWSGTSAEAVARRNALIAALAGAEQHGLPPSRYDVAGLIAGMQSAATAAEKGRMEVALSLAFVRYAQDVSTGLLVPGQIDDGIKRTVDIRPAGALLAGFMAAEPYAFLRGLPPQDFEYSRLQAGKIALEAVIAAGGWGPEVSAVKLEPGDTGNAVIGLRNRLIAMGYLPMTPTGSYDADIQAAVVRFQESHGLEPDGVAGEGTLAEINVSPERRLQSVYVALERERWMNFPRGDRHVYVNLADFTASIVDFDHVTFRTRAVVGANSSDRQSPEFSDLMEHMIINPSWHVPRSIATKEYLPQLQADPTSVSHLIITDRRGQRVDPTTVDFASLDTRNFPFDMRQAPGAGNALGQVKFMFPNRWNIYLHDTPQRSLFGREVRAFSHGCIRLNDPQDFAYQLLSRQTDDPVGLFQSVLRTGQETQVNLETPIPVHLDYRTAVTSVTGELGFRRDVYGRDRKIWNALTALGVATGEVQG